MTEKLNFAREKEIESFENSISSSRRLFRRVRKVANYTVKSTETSLKILGKRMAVLNRQVLAVVVCLPRIFT